MLIYVQYLSRALCVIIATALVSSCWLVTILPGGTPIHDGSPKTIWLKVTTAHNALEVSAKSNANIKAYDAKVVFFIDHPECTYNARQFDTYMACLDEHQLDELACDNPSKLKELGDYTLLDCVQPLDELAAADIRHLRIYQPINTAWSIGSCFENNPGKDKSKRTYTCPFES